MTIVPVTVWHMEIPDPGDFHPSLTAARYTLARLTAPAPEFLRFLYQAVGGPYHWTDRLPWTLEQWGRRLADPAVEVQVAWLDGAPAGYFELERHGDDTVEIAYFGLLPHATGQGHGGALLSDAVRRAWQLEARRVYVNSCSLDHPRAMENYQARGFRVFREEVKEKDVRGEK
jgi:GNAT superfamily N-acetyltransferase